MKNMNTLTWDELGHARAQVNLRHGYPVPLQGPFTELAALLDSNQHDVRRREMIFKISGVAELLSTEQLTEVSDLIDSFDEEKN